VDAGARTGLVERVQNVIEKASVLHEALPYIRRFHGRTFVVKYGGHAMIDAELKASFAKDICLLRYVGIHVVVVHGGGPQINATLAKMGVGSHFVSGLRITDDATMDVVEMVLGGQINQEIVGLICQQGGRAVGLSGKDDGFIRARKMAGVRAKDERGGEIVVDPGRVGEVIEIVPDVVDHLVQAGFIPVISPIGVDREGRSLNINADTAAGKIAEALRAEKLILLTDVEAVRNGEGELIRSLTAPEAKTLIDDGVIHSGMIPKVQCGLDALAGGVKKVHMLDGRMKHAVLLEIFTDQGIGTAISR
jgi:acetylglutamate kinase